MAGNVGILGGTATTVLSPFEGGTAPGRYVQNYGDGLIQGWQIVGGPLIAPEYPQPITVTVYIPSQLPNDKFLSQIWYVYVIIPQFEEGLVTYSGNIRVESGTVSPPPGPCPSC